MYHVLNGNELDAFVGAGAEVCPFCIVGFRRAGERGLLHRVEALGFF